MPLDPVSRLLARALRLINGAGGSVDIRPGSNPDQIKLRLPDTAPQPGEALVHVADGQLDWSSVGGGGPHTHPQSDINGLTTALASKIETDDARLSDARTPTAHGHAQSDITGLTDALAAKAATGHGHSVGDVSGLQAVLDGKASSSHGHAQSDVTGLTDALAGKAASSHTHAPGDISGTAVVDNDPRLSDARTPTAHGHPQGDISGLTAALAAKSDSGHTHPQGDITNLASDLALKAPLASPAFTGTPTGITAAHVGLGNVDNTADSAKPISSAQQTALDGKAALSHAHAQADVTGLVSALAGKAASSHTHAQADITNLVSDLADKLAASALSGVSKISVGTVAPSSPSVGDLWVDTN